LSPDGVARGDYPDLLVYFGDLDFRAIGTVGNPSLYTQSNDTGPDDANHDPDGVLIYRPPGGHKAPGERHNLRLVDIAPTVLGLFGLAPNEGGAGQRMPLE
jgi:predicted AlkP superfamily phosphohydrolase/phosphomutase